MKTKSKILVAVLSVLMILSLFLFVGCQENTTPENLVNPPEPEYKVHSVTLKYNESTVDGVITTDLNSGVLQLSAVVQKDPGANATVTYTSDNPSVATVDNTGKVTLVGKGEAAICAKAGNKTHTIVIVVRDDFSEEKTYTITVVGGIANVTAAAAGEYVTLEAVIPEHKDFQRWNYSVRGVLTNGNVFKMPAQDIVITADYADKLYTLNLVGVADVIVDGEMLIGEVVGNTKDGNDPEYNIVSYGVKYGTEVSVTAYDDPHGMMFVGWDGGVMNNRVGEMGIGEYSFEMPGENYTVWAHYSPLTNKVLTTNPNKYWDTTRGSKEITNVDPMGEAVDPELDGLSGYRLTFSYSEGTTTDFPENIAACCNLDTITEGTSTMKAIFKNHGDADVTIELYATYYGNICTSGHVTIPAKSTVVKYFTGGLGINLPWMGVALREINNHGNSGTFNVDMVLGAAPMYPEGDPLLKTTGKAQLVQLDMGTDSGSNYNWAGSRPFIFNSKYAVLTNSIYGAQFNGKVPAARSVQITNMPEYDPENPYTIIYARVINNATSGDYLSVFDICVGTDRNPINGTNTYSATVVHEKIGDVVVIAIKVPRTENDGPFYLSIRKTTVEGTGTYYPHNFSVVLAYNDVFGYEGDVN